MRRNPIAEVSTRCWKAAGISLLVAGLTGLLGCQGVSSGASGQQSQSGTLSLGIVSIDFGTVTLGSKQTLSETVTNSGGSSVTVSAIGISGSGFALNGVTDAGYVDGRAEHDIQHLVYSTVGWNGDWERDGYFDGIQCDINDCPVGYRNSKCRSVSSLPDNLGSWQRRYRE